MALVTRDEPEAPIDLTRSHADTVRWVVGAALTTITPTVPAARAGKETPEEESLPISLTRAPGETFRWFITGTWLGRTLIALSILLAVAATVGIWYLVPVIDRATLNFLVWLAGTWEGFIGWVESVPDWAERVATSFS